MLHKKMSGINNHPIHSWRVADETARLALVLEADDEGRVCWQEDNDTYWTLLDYSVPTWKNMIGTDGLPGADGADGNDGNGIVSIVRTAGTGAAGSTDTYTITFTDTTTTTFTVVNGADGTNGTDGVDGVDGADGKGIVSITRTSGTGAAGSTDTYTITFTDSSTSAFTVVNGANGTNGVDGVDGTDGTDGVGVPAGGTTGQILAKASGTDFDTTWVDPPTGGGGSGTVEEVVAGHAVTVDNTDPANPVVAVPGGKYTNSLTEPTTPEEGDRWFHPGDGALYTRILDGASLVWAQIG